MTKAEKAKLDEVLREVKELREELRLRTLPVPYPVPVVPPRPVYPPWYVEPHPWGITNGEYNTNDLTTEMPGISWRLQ